MSAVSLSERLVEPVACASEPIRIPGSIQPYGILLALDVDDYRILQMAAGAGGGTDLGDRFALGRSLAECLPGEADRLIRQMKETPGEGATYLDTLRIDTFEGARSFHAIAHRADPGVILELEEEVPGEARSFEHLYPDIRTLLEGVQSATTLQDVATVAARHIRAITGFDRALVYRFDEQWNGWVIAEDGNGVLSSYLGHRFPASDIPAQARELYRSNRLRIIPDAGYTPVPIVPRENPHTGKPLDLGCAVLRSVSPVHLEYMRNMGTWASMSISVLRDGELWGLISCHSQQPRRVGYHVRTACDFIGQILSLQVAAKEQSVEAQQRIGLRAIQTRILANVAAEERFLSGLKVGTPDLLALTGSSGAAIVLESEVSLIGETPDEADVLAVVEWLGHTLKQDIYQTDSLPSAHPQWERIKDVACGLLAVSISQIHSSYVLWFRPEVVRTVAWAGDPRKAELEPGMVLHPRVSFETWKETVRLTSEPWSRTHVEAATELRTAIVDIVLRKAEEMAALNEQLVRSNRELEAFSYSVSHDLRAPFRHIVGYSELLKQFEGDRLSDRGQRYIATIIDSAVAAGLLVDDLLSFSQMGRATLDCRTVDMNMLVSEMRRRMELDVGGRSIDWRVADLPRAWGDPTMLRLVFQNLLGNAIKFTRERDPAVIEVGATRDAEQIIYFVRDNGAGFDMAYVNKLFGVFQRLHHSDEFEGTGIGLANVRRIIERHGGRTWAEGELDRGATIYFSLPQRSEGGR